MRDGRLGPWAVVATSVLLIGGFGACGSDDNGDAAGSNPVDEAPPDIEAVDGCDDALTDITLHDAAIAPPRCEPGAPAAKPLADPVDLTLGFPALTGEELNPILVGIEKGEFEAEGIDLSVEVVSPADATTLLASGDIDLSGSGPVSSIYNAVNDGFDVRWTSGLARRATGPDAGFYMPADKDVADLEGGTIATATGTGSTTIVGLYTALTDAGVDLSSIEFVQLPAADSPSALRNGAVDAALLISPFWPEFAEDDGFTFVAPASLTTEASNGWVMGPSMTGDKREVGVAFMRAYVRTLSTYFAGDYKQDEELVALISELTEVPVDSLMASASLLYDYEVHEGTSDAMQEAYLAAEAVSYGEGEAIEESTFVDRSLLEEAVGQTYE